MDWIDGQNVFGFVVEKHEIPRSGNRPYLENSGDLNIILHTTEGGSLAGALATLGANGDPSTFLVGEGRILQLRPLIAQAAALHDPMNAGCIQIEMVGFSKQTKWLPDDGTLKPAVALLAWLKANLGIPLAVPYDWPDDCSDIKNTVWASDNLRRQKAIASYPAPQGVYMHLEVPHQGPSWHWDCGALQRSVMIEQAEALLAG
jgi:hypothetical protein